MVKQNVLTQFGYYMKPVPRATRSGGLAVIFLTSLKPSSTATSSFAFAHSSFELLEQTLSLQHIQLRFYLLYRPPPSKKTQLSDALFSEQFPDFFPFNTLKGKMLVLGDFNVQYDCDHKMSHMRDDTV